MLLRMSVVIVMMMMMMVMVLAVVGVSMVVVLVMVVVVIMTVYGTLHPHHRMALPQGKGTHSQESRQILTAVPTHLVIAIVRICIHPTSSTHIYALSSCSSGRRKSRIVPLLLKERVPRRG